MLGPPYRFLHSYAEGDPDLEGGWASPPLQSSACPLPVGGTLSFTPPLLSFPRKGNNDVASNYLSSFQAFLLCSSLFLPQMYPSCPWPKNSSLEFRQLDVIPGKEQLLSLSGHYVIWIILQALFATRSCVCLLERLGAQRGPSNRAPEENERHNPGICPCRQEPPGTLFPAPKLRSPRRGRSSSQDPERLSKQGGKEAILPSGPPAQEDLVPVGGCWS